MIGMANAVYWPATERLKMAEFAAEPAKARSPRRRATKTHVHTAFTGVRVYGLTRYIIREQGSAPSRANAKVWRDAAMSCTKKKMRVSILVGGGAG